MDELNQLEELLKPSLRPYAQDPELLAQQKAEQEQARKELTDLIQAQEAETGVRSSLRDALADPAVGGDITNAGPTTTYSEATNPALAMPEPPMRVTQPAPIQLPQITVTSGPEPVQIVDPNLGQDQVQQEPDISAVLDQLAQTQQVPDQLIPPPDYPGAPSQYAKDKAQGIVSGIGNIGKNFMDVVPPIELSDAQIPTGSNLALSGIGDRNIEGAAQIAQIMSGLKGNIGKGIVQQGLISPEAQALQSLTNPMSSANARERETAADRRTRLAADAADRKAKGLPPIDYRTAREKERAAAADEGKRFVIESIGGPVSVSKSELTTLGGLVFVSMGAAFAPKIFKSFKMGILPRLPAFARSNFERPVKLAKPGTIALSTPMDLARTYDDVNAGVMRIGKRYITSPAAVQAVEQVFQLQTRGAAHALGDSAIQMGRAELPGFAFQSKVPLADLAKMDSPAVRDYLHLRDTADDILIQMNKRTPTQAAQAGPVTVRGLTMPDVIQQMTAHERANPTIRKVSDAYRDIVRSVRRFEGDGEYATKSRKVINKLNSTRANEVPWNGPTITGRAVDRGNPFDKLKTSMKAAIRKRLENEAKGTYVDVLMKDKPGSFVRVSPKELTANPDWKRNTVEIYRRGKPEHYTTDPYLAAVLKMDVYSLPQGLKQIYQLKRIFESNTTGLFAPYFAVKSLVRNQWIANITVPTFGKGLTSPHTYQTLAAIPRQLLPQLAKAFGESLNHSNDAWINRVFGQGTTNALSLRLADAYMKSNYVYFATSGSGRSSIMQQQVVSMTRLQDITNTMTGPPKLLLIAYNELLQSMHNAPSFAFGVKNKDKASLPVLASEMRRLTGDNRVGGQFFNTGTGPIPYEGGGRVSHTLGKIVQGYGGLSEAGRVATPWFNATMQGVKRIGESYLENPVTFTGRMWLYGGMPAASLYAYARGLGKDPNGVSYVDDMMNLRSEYLKTMSLPVYIPGKPVGDAVEFPIFQEMSPMSRMMQVAMDHAFGSSIFSEKEDFLAAASSFLQIVAEPPLPVPFNLYSASQGQVGPMGAFTGEAYKRRVDPYDQTGGFPVSVELYARALAPAIAETIGAGYASFTQTPKDVISAMNNALSASGKHLLSRTPFLAEATGNKPPSSGFTLVTQKLFEKQRAIDQLTKHFQKWGGDQQINTKPASVAGGGIVDALVGPAYPGEGNKTPAAGLNQPAPTNPLYNMLMQEIWNKFRRDAPKIENGINVGGMGFRSMWRRYGDATEQINRLRKINDGNDLHWQQQLQERTAKFGTDIPAWLKENNIDATNKRQVLNFFEQSRQHIAKTMLFLIRGVEYEIGNRPEVKQLLNGKPFTIEMLDPYKAGIDVNKDPRTDTEVAGEAMQ